MARCRYKTRDHGEEWECPLDALPGEEYCYWHKKEDGKEPTEEQLKELEEKEIFGVYLQEANLQGVHICDVNLKEADLSQANLQEAELEGANFQEANLFEANLQEANLLCADLQKADLMGANIQGADLPEANFYGTQIVDANLRGANLEGVRFDSKTYLGNSVLVGANLFRSYFDEAKSFRNATVFQNDGDKEINEIVGDVLDDWFIRILEKVNKYPVKIISKLMFFCRTRILKKPPCVPLFLKPSVLDLETIEKKAPRVVAKFRGKGLIRYVVRGEKIIFFDRSSGCAIENPENRRRHKERLIRVEELTDLILKDGKIQSEFLYQGNRASLYEASYEVYNNLYNFYIANGRLDQAAHVHYRRGEVHRKLRWARGGLKNRTRSIFDLLILRTLTGYGDRIGRPIFISGLIIGLFAALFWLSDGIVKNVNGELATPDWIDYIYHSITTFTSLGYSNIQPNLAVGHLPQVLVAFESGLGVLMMALIIFVVTYQVSR